MNQQSPLENATPAKVQKFIRETSPHRGSSFGGRGSSPSPIQNAALLEKIDVRKYTSFGLSEKELCYYKAVYEMFASPSSGTLSPAELRHLFAYLGINMNRSELFKVLCEFDLDENGYLDFNDFLKVVTDRISLYQMDNVRAKREIFRSLSAKDSITFESLKLAFAKNGIAVSEEECLGIYTFLMKRIEEKDQAKIQRTGIEFNDFNNVFITLHQELGLALKQEKSL